MKKLLAIVLSVVMAVSLAVPAFADGPDGPPMPENLGVIGGADGPTAVIISAPVDGFSWWTADDEQALMDGLKQAQGGVAGQVGVMVNGWYIKFPDAAPEVVNGRTMAPVQALAEALGGEMEFADGKAVCRTDEIRLTFTPGSREVLVEYPGGELPGDGQMFPLDCAPYVKGGQTYVPVRFVAEALGYEVGWDRAYETAVLLDREGVAEEWDQVFTILNRALENASYTVEEGKNYRFDQRGEVTLTAFDTLNGNTTYRAGFTGRELLSSEAANGTYSLTMSDNVADALMLLLMGDDEAMTEEDYGIAWAILTGLKNVEVILTREGLAWMRIPALDELAGEKNIWCALPVGPDAAAAAFAGTGTTTMGRLLTAGLDVDSAMSWVEQSPMVQTCAAFLGDGAWTTSGGVSTLKLDLDSLDPGEELGLKEAFKELDITLKVDSRGGADLSCTMQTAEGQPGMRLTINCTISGGRVSLTANAHVSNVGEMKLSLTYQRQTTGQQPVEEPPEGANITDTPALLNGYEGFNNEW